MMNKLKIVLFALAVSFSLQLNAQNTTNSPYSQFGLGDIKPFLLPQNISMGGLAIGIRKPGGYNNINVANPASYSAINLSSFDIGATLDVRKMSKATRSQKTTNGALSHLLFAVPVSSKSAMSFGLMPYSDLGYRYRSQILLDTIKVDQIYSGEGGLARAHLGYAYQIGKHLSLGFNFAYIFGDLKLQKSTELSEDAYALSSRNQSDKNVGGLNYQYGVQYVVNPDAKRILTFGYSGTVSSTLKTSGSETSFRYAYNSLTLTESAPIDTIFYNSSVESRLTLPSSHGIGFSLESPNKWVFGADFTYTNWSKFVDSGKNPGLKDSYTFNVGGRYTPDYTAVSNYFKLIDYALGFKYDRTYINLGGRDINQYALCLGFGLPLPSNRFSFYKVNLSAELGKRGTLSSNLVRENYINLRLGFTLNDKWFIKAKYD